MKKSILLLLCCLCLFTAACGDDAIKPEREPVAVPDIHEQSYLAKIENSDSAYLLDMGYAITPDNVSEVISDYFAMPVPAVFRSDDLSPDTLYYCDDAKIKKSLGTDIGNALADVTFFPGDHNAGADIVSEIEFDHSDDYDSGSYDQPATPFANLHLLSGDNALGDIGIVPYGNGSYVVISFCTVTDVYTEIIHGENANFVGFYTEVPLNELLLPALTKAEKSFVKYSAHSKPLDDSAAATKITGVADKRALSAVENSDFAYLLDMTYKITPENVAEVLTSYFSAPAPLLIDSEDMQIFHLYYCEKPAKAKELGNLMGGALKKVSFSAADYDEAKSVRDEIERQQQAAYEEAYSNQNTQVSSDSFSWKNISPKQNSNEQQSFPIFHRTTVSNILGSVTMVPYENGSYLIIDFQTPYGGQPAPGKNVNSAAFFTETPLHEYLLPTLKELQKKFNQYKLY